MGLTPNAPDALAIEQLHDKLRRSAEGQPDGAGGWVINGTSLALLEITRILPSLSARLAAVEQRAVKPTIYKCTRCGEPILDGAFVGDGDGSGQRFAHYDCYFADRTQPAASPPSAGELDGICVTCGRYVSAHTHREPCTTDAGEGPRVELWFVYYNKRIVGTFDSEAQAILYRNRWSTSDGKTYTHGRLVELREGEAIIETASARAMNEQDTALRQRVAEAERERDIANGAAASWVRADETWRKRIEDARRERNEARAQLANVERERKNLVRQLAALTAGGVEGTVSDVTDAPGGQLSWRIETRPTLAAWHLGQPVRVIPIPKKGTA